MACVQPRIRPGKRDAQTSQGFWDTNGSPDLGQTTRPSDSQQKKENFPNCGLCCLSRPQGKIERNRKVPRPC